MGTWGTGLFDDDVAADIRGEWQSRLESGIQPSQATDEIVDGLGSDLIHDVDDGPVFWIALAALQLEADALETGVAERAEEAIALNLVRWREESDPDSFAERSGVLNELSRRISDRRKAL